MNYHLEPWLKTHLKSRKDRRKKVVKSQPMYKDSADPIRPYRGPMPKGWVEKVEAARKQVQLRIRSETGRLTKDGPKLPP